MPQILTSLICLLIYSLSFAQADENSKKITGFYTAFSQKNATLMTSYYDDSILFYDPAFGYLEAERAKSMWEMICENGDDLLIVFSNIEANENSGEAHWEADYTFTATNKKVHNVIDASFVFKDGKIIKHIDNFDFKLWSKQAFGFFGKTIGQTKFFHKRFTKKANKILDKYIAQKNGK